MIVLDNLSREDLIKVIANMHDTIQEWDSGWGLEENEAQILIAIGDTCRQHCKETNWDLPNIVFKP